MGHGCFVADLVPQGMMAEIQSCPDSRITFAHYRELVRAKDAERYWGIRWRPKWNKRMSQMRMARKTRDVALCVFAWRFTGPGSAFPRRKGLVWCNFLGATHLVCRCPFENVI